MKFCVLLIMVNVFVLTGLAQKKQNIDNVLKITGTALLNNQRVSDYSVSIYLDGTRIDSTYTKSKKSIKFYAAYNKVYTLLFQKENYKDKIVIVNTQLPDGSILMKDDRFDFEVEMFQVSSKNNKELEDNSVAVLSIDKKEQILQASTDYKFTHSDPKAIKTNRLDTASDKKMDKK